MSCISKIARTRNVTVNFFLADAPALSVVGGALHNLKGLDYFSPAVCSQTGFVPSDCDGGFSFWRVKL
jgi:hypothetical protein